MIVQQVPIQYVHAAWPKVEWFIASALEYSDGEYTPEQAKVFVANGQWALFVAVNEENEVKGAACVQFNNMPNDRVAFIMALGGRGILNPACWEQLRDAVRLNGATCIQGACRASVTRLWARCGAREKYRIVEARL